MKKYILSVLLVIASANIFAQETVEEYKGRNEFKLNIGYLLAGFPEISYERLTGEGSAAGISVGFTINEEFFYNFSVIPYYRLYFGKKPAAGFFIEGNGAVFSEGYTYSENTIRAGLGVSFGGKFLTKKGWIGEVNAGLGVILINRNEPAAFLAELNNAYPRFGITIGKRF